MILRRVLLPDDDGTLHPSEWEDEPFPSFGDAVNAWVENWREAQGRAEIVELEPLRAVILTDHDWSDESLIFVIVGEPLNG